MTIHSSIFAWEIPWAEEPGRLQTMGSQKSWIRLKWLNNRPENPTGHLSSDTTGLD